jgi:hypothetical protein
LLFSIELFKDYTSPKEGPKAPKKFTDCARIYSKCIAPNEHPIGLKKKRKSALKVKNETESINESINEIDATTEIDPVTQYVKQRKV